MTGTGPVEPAHEATMSTIRASISLVLLAMAACVTEAPGAPEGAESIDIVEGATGGADTRVPPVGALPRFAHPDRVGQDTGTTPPATACSLLAAAHVDGIAGAIRRSVVLMDRDVAEGHPDSHPLATEARAALKEALTHATFARDTMLDGEASLDGDAAVTSVEEGAAVRERLQIVVAELDRALDLAVQRASLRHAADRGAGYHARQAAVLAGKSLSVAHDLRSRAVECELGIWR